MSDLAISCAGIVFFVFLVSLRMPIGFSFAFVGFAGLALLGGTEPALKMLGAAPFMWASSDTLICLPLFILMGQFVHYSRISDDLYDCAYKWIGKAPGGLALATNLACTCFAACTGSSLASAATMGTIALPEMKKHNYNMRLATGSVAAGGTLGILIPPSVIFIIYGYLTEQSIGMLFIAGILPGILLSTMFLVLILLMCIRNPKLGPPASSFPFRQKIVALKGIVDMLSLFILVIGGLYFGIFTPSEAGATGAFGAFILSLFRRRLSLKLFINALKQSVNVTCFALTILIGAMIFSVFLVHSGLPSILATWIASLSIPPYLVLCLILTMFIPLGMIMDALPMILLTIPIIFPIIVELGFDPIWFGVLVVVMSELALISPPVGMNVFIIRGIATDVPMHEIFKGVLPFSITTFIGIIILIVFPQISLFLPMLMKG